MNTKKVIQHQNWLLDKERGIKLGSVATQIILVLYLILLGMAVWKNETTYFLDKTWNILWIIGIGVYINSLHLKHIATLKLYKDK